MLLVQAAGAAPQDAEGPVQVEANRADLDQNTGESIYYGEVVVTQGRLRLDAEKVIILTPKAGPQSITSTGAPARFVQQPAAGEDLVTGEAARMDYDMDRRYLILQGDAVLHRGEDLFRSEHIEYDLNARLIQAGDPHSDRARVRMTIQPRNTAKPGE